MFQRQTIAFCFGVLSLFFTALGHVQAQQTFPQPAPADRRPDCFAFTHARIFTDFQTVVEDATLVIRNGRIEAVGKNITPPLDAVIQDATGKTIYPAFIDLYAAGYGVATPKSEPGVGRDQPRPFSEKKGAFGWNEALRSDYETAQFLTHDAKAAESWRKAGFTTLLTHRPDGIDRGVGALICLDDQREHLSFLKTRASHQLSFKKGSSRQDYPSSLMGCVALLRQTALDGRWYQSEGYKTEKNLSLEAWNNAQNLVQIFEADNKLDVLRIARLGREMGVKFVVKTAGDEYQRLDEIKSAGMPLILPLQFPEGYDLRDPFDAQRVTLRELKHWELAPSNPGRVEAAGIPFAITMAGLKDKNQFWEALRKAVQFGLSEKGALKALTLTPAQLIGVENELGSLEMGKRAHFFITDGDIFQPETHLLETWANGKGFVTQTDNADLPARHYGRYTLSVEGYADRTLVVEKEKDKPNAYIALPGGGKSKVQILYRAPYLNLTAPIDSAATATLSLTGLFDRNAWTGKGLDSSGRWVGFSLQLVEAAAPKSKPAPEKTNPNSDTGPVIYPFTAFGRTAAPRPRDFVIRNATVWTNEKEGVLQNADVLVTGGKIARVGKKLSVNDNTLIIDGTGKHVTAGIIDEHSHIAVSRGVNEGTQESSAEVRIGDALDSEDIDIYRQLAGGVTTSHLLHGSANPIGGQTQLIKLRWGYAPEDLKFQGWPGFIKFALGENVKQSNWGDQFTQRYPQSRMGVEQTFIDYFTRAAEYQRLKKSGKPWRPDLELEALAEILNKERFITCHSYVQSEIVMLMRVAEKFGFKVNTFTHILEGYKIADKMARHGAGGSSFSDWWDYKMEVYEAIAYNAAIMHRQGVVVAINSDDAEMARRLNQEAAKAVLYGGVGEEDALKMVTLNPAKLLHIDDRVGSLRAGKDADVVLWNAHPLSVYARAEKTWVDGALFFDRDDDEKMQRQIETERKRILQKMQKSSVKGGDKPESPKHHYHCDSEEDEG